MTTIAIFINTILFIAIGAVHVYWAFGGKRFSEGVLPLKADNSATFQPGVLATLIVAFGLFGFAAITVASMGVFSDWLSPEIVRYGMYAITAIFALRAVGDFYYAGFFKKIKNTTFAKKDTQFYTPLCVVISILSLIIILFL
jgi:energy-converting hydrogenase Eha subunit H